MHTSTKDLTAPCFCSDEPMMCHSADETPPPDEHEPLIGTQSSGIQEVRQEVQSFFRENCVALMCVSYTSYISSYSPPLPLLFLGCTENVKIFETKWRRVSGG